MNFSVLQVFQWVETLLSRTQRRGTRTRNRLKQFKSITFSGMLPPPVFGPFFNEIPTLPFEYEYRFTEYENEYEKYRRYELPATIIPDGPIFFASQPLAPCFYRRLERLNHSLR